MKQERIQKQSTRTPQHDVDEAPAPVETVDVTDTLDAIDDALDEQLDLEILDFMDDVLEENAAEFVTNYVQQGGE